MRIYPPVHFDPSQVAGTQSLDNHNDVSFGFFHAQTCPEHGSLLALLEGSTELTEAHTHTDICLKVILTTVAT